MREQLEASYGSEVKLRHAFEQSLQVGNNFYSSYPRGSQFGQSFNNHRGAGHWEETGANGEYFRWHPHQQNPAPAYLAHSYPPTAPTPYWFPGMTPDGSGRPVTWFQQPFQGEEGRSKWYYQDMPNGTVRLVRWNQQADPMQWAEEGGSQGWMGEEFPEDYWDFWNYNPPPQRSRGSAFANEDCLVNSDFNDWNEFSQLIPQLTVIVQGLKAVLPLIKGGLPPAPPEEYKAGFEIKVGKETGPAASKTTATKNDSTPKTASSYAYGNRVCLWQRVFLWQRICLWTRTRSKEIDTKAASNKAQGTERVPSHPTE